MLNHNDIYILQKKIQHQIMRCTFPITRQECLTMRGGPKIFANSLPKAGTHLLRRILSMMPGVIDRLTYHYDIGLVDYEKQLSSVRGGQIVSAHAYWSEELSSFLGSNGLKSIFITRDPRDVSISNAYYCASDKRHRLYRYFRSLPSHHERISASICGVDSASLLGAQPSKSIGEHLDGYAGWVSDGDTLYIKFEDLVGIRGGGTEERQLECVRSIGAHLGMELNSHQLRKIIDNSFSDKTKTFRKGQVGSWKNEFSPFHVEKFKEIAGKYLITYGYESGFDWEAKN